MNQALVKHICLCLFLFLMQGSFLLAEERGFQKNKLEELCSDDVFDQELKGAEVPYYGTEPEKKGRVDELYGDTRSRIKRRSSNFDVSNMGALFRMLMYLFAGTFILAIVILVLRKAFAGSGQDLYSKKQGKESELDIKKMDTQSLISQAVKAGDFRMAVRLQYLDVLKKLDAKGRIKWSAEKTNQDYLKELSGSKLLETFKLLTFHFDYAWYGDFAIGADLYQKLESSFVNFHKRI